MDITYALKVTAVIETSTFDAYYGNFSPGTETYTFAVSSGTYTYTCEDYSVMTPA